MVGLARAGLRLCLVARSMGGAARERIRVGDSLVASQERPVLLEGRRVDSALAGQLGHSGVVREPGLPLLC